MKEESKYGRNADEASGSSDSVPLLSTASLSSTQHPVPLPPPRIPEGLFEPGPAPLRPQHLPSVRPGRPVLAFGVQDPCSSRSQAPPSPPPSPPPVAVMSAVPAAPVASRLPDLESKDWGPSSMQGFCTNCGHFISSHVQEEYELLSCLVSIRQQAGEVQLQGFHSPEALLLKYCVADMLLFCRRSSNRAHYSTAPLRTIALIVRRQLASIKRCVDAAVVCGPALGACIGQDTAGEKWLLQTSNACKCSWRRYFWQEIQPSS